MTQWYSRMTGTGSYLPEKILTNRDLEKMVDTSDEWIRDRTGICQRHIVGDHETTTSMAFAAAENALASAELKPEEIELIIVGTCTPDREFPSTACLLQQQFHIAGCPAFDLTAACAGFIYGLAIADSFIKTGAIKTALVVGSESLSRIVDWTDRSTCVLFGDGAGAVVLQRSTEPGIRSTHLHADGCQADLLYVPRKSTAPHLADEPLIHMQGNKVFRYAVEALDSAVVEALHANQLQGTDIDWLIPHQANLRIIQATAKKLKLPMEKVIVTVDKHSNTSAASIPLALDLAVRSGKVKRGQNLLLEAIGGGLAWGSVLITY